jgi:hypothetical protein
MICIVCGGRRYGYMVWERRHIHNELRERTRNQDPGLILPDPKTLIITGGARGTDTVAHAWAVMNSVSTRVFPADWDKYGKRAGHIRNQQMLDEGLPSEVLAFPGGPGTEDMIRRALRKRIKVTRCVSPGVAYECTLANPGSFDDVVW